MKSFWNNYKSSLILLGAIILGGIVGVFMGPEAVIFKPVGDLFLNLLFMILVPLVFFSVTSAISNMGEMKRLGKILKNIVIVFVTTAIISGVKGLNSDMFANLMATASDHASGENVSLLQQLVNTVTVTDFKDLLSKSNMLQLIIFSILVGIATAMAGDVAKPMAKFVEAGAAVMMKIVNIIMYIAPIGLGCYFASVIGELGPQILSGYAKLFVILDYSHYMLM